MLICHSVYMPNFCPEWTFVHLHKRNRHDLKPGEPCSGVPFTVSSLERLVGTVLVENLRALLFKLRKKKGNFCVNLGNDSRCSSTEVSCLCTESYCRLCTESYCRLCSESYCRLCTESYCRSHHLNTLRTVRVI